MLDVEWTDDASAQYYHLTPAQQQSAATTINAIRRNPAIRKYYNTKPLADGGEQVVYAVEGLRVIVTFTLQGRFWRRLVVQIEGIISDY